MSTSLHTCAECERETDASIDSYDGEDKIICDRCEEIYTWCEICQTHNSSEMSNPCRHLFWDDEDGWQGFGSDSFCWNSGKRPFLAMLQMAGTEFATDLKRSLDAHKYYFQFRGSIFGVESIFAQLLQEDGRMSFDFNGPINAVFEEDDEEKQKLAATGISWLMSLWSGSEHDEWESPETIDADLLAASWCTEFLEKDL